MSTANYMDLILDPVVNAFTPELAKQIAELEVDKQLQARVDELADKANEGSLSADEDAEYKRIIYAVDVVSVIQLKARRFQLQSSDNQLHA